MSVAYSINDLERLSGIKAHTIRIWERRYGLLAPERSETNIRKYSDSDLRKILNVNTLLQDGWKISKVSELTPQDLEAEVWNAASDDKPVAQVYEIYVQAMISASLAFDEEWFENVYTDVTTRYGLPAAMQHVVSPFLARIGLMWAVMKLHPGQEHFSSNLIRRKLMVAIDRLPKINSRGTYLLFLPPWEEHEIGLLYTWYLLRSNEYDVIYLGQRVPLEALTQSIEAVQPDAVFTYMVTEPGEGIMESLLDLYQQTAQGIPLMIGASQGILPGISLPKGVHILHSAQELTELL